jgi:alcohol dehydrogenase
MYAPTRILFGAGELKNLHKQTMPGKKAMIVISNGKSGRSILPRVEEQMKLRGIETTVFDKVEANPLKATVEEGAAFFRKNGCDFVLALGGGSVIDSAKVMALLAANPGDLWDYVSCGTFNGNAAHNPPYPVVAITTTAGTGSEVDTFGGIKNPETKEKVAFGGREDMFPVLALVDPELMISVPPQFTAYQGFDALFHSIEGYISALANILSDMFALTAIESAARYLPVAVRDGGNIEAREKVAFANTLSGIVMLVDGLTSHHALENGMSAYHQDLPHGAGLIMLSKAYFTCLINNHVCDERFVKMAEVMGHQDAKEPADFITALEKLKKDCGVAELKMSDFGIEPDNFLAYTKTARATSGVLFSFDKRQLSDEDCVKILKEAYR